MAHFSLAENGLLFRDRQHFGTIAGGTWRIAGCRAYWSKYESPWDISPTANQLDAIEVVELALSDYETLFRQPPVNQCPIDPDTGELLPVVTLVIDNDGSFRSFQFDTFIAQHPELHHVRTGVLSPGQNGSHECGFESLQYARLYLHEITDVLELDQHAEDDRGSYRTIRPQEFPARKRALQVHFGSLYSSQPQILPSPRTCHLLEMRQCGIAGQPLIKLPCSTLGSRTR